MSRNYDAIIVGTGQAVCSAARASTYAKAPYPVLQRAMHIHPTVAELIPTILQELARPAS
jgi:hypothetical protein